MLRSWKGLSTLFRVFSRNDRITAAYKEFYDATAQDATLAIRDQKLIGLILTVFRQLGYRKVEEFTIANVLFLVQTP